MILSAINGLLLSALGLGFAVALAAKLGERNARRARRCRACVKYPAAGSTFPSACANCPNLHR